MRVGNCYLSLNYVSLAMPIRALPKAFGERCALQSHLLQVTQQLNIVPHAKLAIEIVFVNAYSLGAY